MGTCLTMIKIGGGGLKWIKAIPLWMWPPYTFNIPPPPPHLAKCDGKSSSYYNLTFFSFPLQLLSDSSFLESF